MQTGRSLESSQIQDYSSGKLSRAFYTSTATVTAVSRELYMLQESEDKAGRVRTVDRALLFCALQDDFADFSVVCYVGLVYPRPHFGLPLLGEAVRDEPAQYISMRAPETTVTPNKLSSSAARFFARGRSVSLPLRHARRGGGGGGGGQKEYLPSSRRYRAYSARKLPI